MEKSDELRGPSSPLLVVYSVEGDGGKRTQAARRVWDRIVYRTQDPELKRNLQSTDLEVFPYDGTDRVREVLSKRLSEGDITTILAVGEHAFAATTGHSGVLKLRGYAIPVQSSGDTTVVVGTYGADYILAGHYHLARVVQSDLLKALEIARKGVRSIPKRYQPHPSYEDAAAFLEEWRVAGRPPIAFDIETPYSNKKDEGMTFEDDDSYTILMVSFAFRPCEAISLPWMPPYDSVVKAILAEAEQTLVWNAKFDVPRLMANGCEFGGQIVDAMLAWHWLEPSLPMGLKFVAPFLCPDMDAWALGKGEDFATYNCADSDVLYRAFLKIKDRLIGQNRWAIFERHFLEFGKILTRMTKRGIKVDLDARRAARAEFENELAAVINQAVEVAPSEVRPVHPKKGYKKDRAALEKGGLWVEGEMRLINVEISDEEYQKEAEKQARKEKREAARRAKKVGKKAPKRAVWDVSDG